MLRRVSAVVNLFLGRVGLRVVRVPIRSKWPFSTDLIPSEGGYWHLKTMPSQLQLNRYYAATYWSTFRGTPQPEFLNSRDLEHFDLLDQFDALVAGRCFVNFGAGHGGLSFLAAARGMQVVNVDPFAMPVWRGKYSAELLGDPSADVLYSSHSLEHVVNIRDTMSNFFAAMRPGGLCLIEVPDLSRHWPHSRPDFHEPHTFYFTEQFFSEQIGEFRIELLRHRRQTRKNGLSYTVPGGPRDSDVLQVVLRKPYTH